MVVFDLWVEGLILGMGYLFIVGIPCVFLALIGRRIIDKLGHYPSQTPLILKSQDYWKFVATGSLALVLLIMLYFVLNN